MVISTYVLSEPAKWGHMVESAIGAHLINSSLNEGFKLHYWRERDEEVDFVIETKGKTIGIEVKSGATQSASGMTAFQKAFNPHKVLLIGRSGLSWEEFLKIDPLKLFWR